MSTGGSLLGVSVLEIRTDQRQLDAGLASAKAKVDASATGMQAGVDKRMTSLGGSVGKSMRTAGSATADAQLKLKGYELQVQAAEQRVNRLSAAVKAGSGDQARLNEALSLAQGKLDLANSRLGLFEEHAARAAAESRSLAAETGVSSRAFSDLYRDMGPVGSALGDLTTRTRLYRDHGLDYLAAGVIGVEGAFVGLSARAAVNFADLGETVQRQTGLSGRALDSLMATIRAVTRDSPYEMSQVADAAVILRQSFHESDPQISHTADLMIAFSKAAGQDVRPEMQTLSRIMHDYNEPLGNVVGLTDKLVSISQATQQPLGQMVDTLDRFGPRFQAMGFSLKDSIRLLGIFQASGIPVEQMGRGLATALTNVPNATTGGSTKLETYRLAVQSAQERVDSLRQSLAAGTGDQQKENAELQIAEGRLSVAKQKYSALNTTLQAAKGAHGSISTAIETEIRQIVNAGSKQDALNLAVQYFGKNLGPSMAKAFYDNKKALDEVDQAMGKAHATQRLFNVDAKSLPGEIQKAKNNFQDLEIEVGTKLVPALSDGAKWVGNTIREFDDFYKKHPELVKIAGGIAGIGSALTLLSRHSPLGSILGRVLASAGHTGLASVLSGKSGGGIFGVEGVSAPGSLANPIATFVKNGGAGTPGGAASTAEKDTLTAAEEGETSAGLAASVQAGLKTALGRGMQGLMIGTIGVGLSDVIGSAIHGAVGKAVKDVGGDASIGAGFGAMFGPEGIVGGAVVGGLVGAIKDALSSDSYGASVSKQIFSHGFGGQQAPNLSKEVGAALDALKRDETTGTRTVQMAGKGAPAMKVPVQLDFSQLSPRQQAKVLADARRAGGLVAKQLEAGWDQYKFQSEPIMFEQLRSKLKQLPPQAQAAAVLSAVKFAQGLERQGRLSKGSAAKLLSGIEQQFPAFERYLGLAGQSGIKQFNKAFTLNTLEHNISTELRKISGDFPQVQKAVSDTAGTVEQKSAAAIKALRKIQSDGTGPMKRQATRDINQLASNVMSDLQKTSDFVISEAGKLAPPIQHGSKQAALAASTNFGNFASNVNAAMSSGVLSTQQGAKLINNALNATLHAYGSNRIPIGITVTAAGMKQKGLGTLSHLAGGGVIPIGRPGYPGRDTIPLTVGGNDIMVGEGETAVIFNRHQIPDVNARFADTGGLGGYFRKNKRPNYMSTGGIVPGYDAGGYVYPFPGGTTLGRTDEGVDANMPVGAPIGAIGPARVMGVHPGWYAGQPLMWEMLTGGPMAGRYIYLAEQINKLASGTLGPHSALAHYAPSGTGIEMGWATASGETLAKATSGYSEGQVTAAGASFRDFIMGLAHGVIRGGGGGAQGSGRAWQDIPTPKVKGSGTVADIVRGALQKSDRAANAYGQAHVGAGGGVSAAGLSGNLIQIVRQIAGRKGWSGQVQDWLDVIMKESSGSMTARNPSSGAYGIAQFIDGPGEYAKYGGNVNTLAGQLVAMANYIAGRYGNPAAAWAHEQGFNWYSQGGIVGDPHQAFSGGGSTGSTTSSVSASTARRLNAARQTSKEKKKSPVEAKLPKLKSVPGFNDQDITKLGTMDQTVNDLQAWQSYVESLHSGGASLEPLVTLADGSEVINWGKKGGPSPSGLVDPSTNQVTKGIFDRLAEIGDPAQAKIAHPQASLGVWDKNTELGIEEQILDTWIQEQILAGKIAPQIASWTASTSATMKTDNAEVAWLTKALDLSQPLPKIAGLFKNIKHVVDWEAWGMLSSQHPWIAKLPRSMRKPIYGSVSSEVMRKVSEYRNAQAVLDRWTDLKAKIPDERAKRDEGITREFASRRFQLEQKSATSTFTGSELLNGALYALQKEKTHALDGVTKPSGWKGSAKAWGEQAKREREDITGEFTDREQALRKAAGKAGLNARLSRQSALFNLGQQETADKDAVHEHFSQESTRYTDLIRGKRSKTALNKKWLTDLRKSLSTQASAAKTGYDTVTGSGGDLDTLTAYLDPMGTLAINIDTAQNVDTEPSVPGYLTETSQLLGTTAPATDTVSSAADQQLLGLEEQQHAQDRQALAVEDAQAGVMSQVLQQFLDLPPFGGIFHGGGTVPGPIGAERTIIAQGGEKITALGDDSPPLVHETHVHVAPKPGFDQMIDTRVEEKTRKMVTPTRRRIPSAGGGSRGVRVR
jgi:hypothetical protein